MGSLITGAATILFGWLLVTGFKTGAMEFPYGSITLSVRRRDQPVRFWLTASFVAILTRLCALGTLGQIFFPQGL